MATNDGSLFHSFVMDSYVRVHHVYGHIWSLSEGEVLNQQQEPSNPKDKLAVVICLDRQVVNGFQQKETIQN